MINETDKHIHQIEPIPYEIAFEQMKREVSSTLTASPLVIRDYTKHLSTSLGKSLRAVCVLTSAMEENGFVHPTAVRWAASIELLHLATLVHDDVIDNADLRRGELSLQKKYGKRTAVICGDYLLAVSLAKAASIENKEDYLKLQMPSYVSRVCLGELDQHINNGNYDLSVYRYLKIIAGKTAALFEASFFAGAILLGADETTIHKYAKFGRYLGMIFQLTDDCMDFETTEHVAKKPVQSDYEQSVITLPLIHAFRQMAGFREKAKQEGLTREEINQAVMRSEGLGYTRRIARHYYTKAEQLLAELRLTGRKQEMLISLLEKAYRVF